MFHFFFPNPPNTVFPVDKSTRVFIYGGGETPEEKANLNSQKEDLRKRQRAIERELEELDEKIKEQEKRLEKTDLEMDRHQAAAVCAELKRNVEKNNLRAQIETVHSSKPSGCAENCPCHELSRKSQPVQDKLTRELTDHNGFFKLLEAQYQQERLQKKQLEDAKRSLLDQKHQMMRKLTSLINGIHVPHQSAYGSTATSATPLLQRQTKR